MIHDFTDLIVWQKAHVFVVKIYTLVKNFPSYERYGLADQLRRASVSITSNIAEGSGRYTYKDKAQFFRMALGSTTEVRNQLYIARDVGYFKEKLVNEELLPLIVEIQRMLFGLMKTTKLHNG